MNVVCLDLEGVLVPEIWIAFAEKTGLKELHLTTRDVSDYHELMEHRLGVLNREKLNLHDILAVIETLEPLSGALDFIRNLRAKTQLIILSDTFDQFAAPLMRKLEMPTIFCNTLKLGSAGQITGYRLRQADGKRQAVDAFHSMGLRVFAAGDSYNDISMLQAADKGMFFRTPESIRKEYAELHACSQYDELQKAVTQFLAEPL